MTLHPTHVVIGASDLDRMVAVLQPFGFAVTARAPVAAATARALYGLDTASEQVVMHVPGVDRGWLRLVRTPWHSPPAGAFDHGPHAIDLYTRDIESSVRLADEIGASHGPIVEYAVGPMTVKEAKAVGPDHVAVVFIQVDRRRPSVLDIDPARVHSEVHSAVWTVARADAALPFWTETAGLRVLLDATFREPAVGRLMQLPRPDSPLRLTVLADADGGAPRFELLEFPDDPGQPLPTGPLRGGLHALGAHVRAVEATVRQWTGLAWREVVSLAPGSRVVTGMTPEGVCVELWDGDAPVFPA